MISQLVQDIWIQIFNSQCEYSKYFPSLVSNKDYDQSPRWTVDIECTDSWMNIWFSTTHVTLSYKGVKIPLTREEQQVLKGIALSNRRKCMENDYHTIKDMKANGDNVWSQKARELTIGEISSLLGYEIKIVKEN